MESAGRPTPTLRAIDTEGLVIYVGSMSKILSPGLRLGFRIVKGCKLHSCSMARAGDFYLPSTCAQPFGSDAIGRGDISHCQ